MSFTVDQMREMLPRAKAYRDSKTQECDLRIEALLQQVEDAKRERDTWSSKIPADVFPILIEIDREREASTVAAREHEFLLKARNQALEAAYLKRRAILPPEVIDEKRMIFSSVLSLASIAVAHLLVLLFFGSQTQWTIVATVVIGLVVGLPLGASIFRLNFVVDPSLEVPATWKQMNRFSPHRPQLKPTESGLT